MKIKDPLKKILEQTRATWDRRGFRSISRHTFRRILLCGTPAMGGDRYASENGEKVVYWTCKSRMCPKCGRRMTLVWQRNQMAALPNMRYAGIVLTMPDVLWELFRDNRQLLDDLPILGAEVIGNWVKQKFGAQAAIMVVRHTFGRHLNFNVHLHILVSALGWHSADAQLVALTFHQNGIMRMWQYAVISYLRAALKAGALRSNQADCELWSLFKRQYERWWSVYIDDCESKDHFIQYAGRYAKHPPIAQHRFFKIDNRDVRFRTYDHRLKRAVTTTYTPDDFVKTLSHHVPDHGRHSIRYFGLLSPRWKGQKLAAVFATLGQKRPLKPSRVSWPDLSMESFGVDPLLDRNGQRMKWVGQVSSSLLGMA